MEFAILLLTSPDKEGKNGLFCSPPLPSIPLTDTTSQIKTSPAEKESLSLRRERKDAASVDTHEIPSSHPNSSAKENQGKIAPRHIRRHARFLLCRLRFRDCEEFGSPVTSLSDCTRRRRERKAFCCILFLVSTTLSPFGVEVSTHFKSEVLYQNAASSQMLTLK